jgi:hypothetical protein
MTMTCEELHELAPELALGIADGDRRAAALDHLAGCDGCREELVRLTRSVDAVLATAPAVEPPSGFEVRALSTFEPVAPPPRRRPPLLAAAAAVLAIIALLAASAAIVNSRNDRPTEQAASAADASLLAPDGTDVGNVRIERTSAGGGATRSTLVVSVDAGAPEGRYRVQCDYESGRPYGAGQLAVGPDGLASWRADVAVPTYDLRRVRLISTTGDANLEAEFT